MTDRPILFNGPMVLALLREIEAVGTGKTQTRRALRTQPKRPFGGLFRAARAWWTGDSLTGERFEDLRVPYATGDRLYVRETWGVYHDEYLNDPYEPIWYRATDEPPEDQAGPSRWRPSIHMPRRASRITLDVTEVRVQRLQEISEEDAKAEGVTIEVLSGRDRELFGRMKTWPELYRPMFKFLWDSLNAKPRPRYATIDGQRIVSHYESFPWSAGTRTETYCGRPHHIIGNPWVAAVTFKPRLGNIDASPQRTTEGNEK